MQQTTVRLRFPVKGVALAMAYCQQPELTTPSAVNVRAFDLSEDCTRGGQRPGTQKWHSAQVQGTTNPVQDMNTLAERT